MPSSRIGCPSVVGWGGISGASLFPSLAAALVPLPPLEVLRLPQVLLPLPLQVSRLLQLVPQIAQTLPLLPLQVSLLPLVQQLLLLEVQLLPLEVQLPLLVQPPSGRQICK